MLCCILIAFKNKQQLLRTHKQASILSPAHMYIWYLYTYMRMFIKTHATHFNIFNCSKDPLYVICWIRNTYLLHYHPKCSFFEKSLRFLQLAATKCVGFYFLDTFDSWIWICRTLYRKNGFNLQFNFAMYELIWFNLRTFFLCLAVLYLFILCCMCGLWRLYAKVY